MYTCIYIYIDMYVEIYSLGPKVVCVEAACVAPLRGSELRITGASGLGV